MMMEMTRLLWIILWTFLINARGEFISENYDLEMNRKISVEQTTSLYVGSLTDCVSACTSENCCSASYRESTRECIFDVVNNCSRSYADETGWYYVRGASIVRCRDCIWNGDSGYKILTDVVDWQTAVTKCQSVGGKLLEIETDAENIFVKALMSSATTTSHGFWLGGYSFHSDYSFTWISNPYSPMTFLDFNIGEPNNPSAEQCLEAYKVASFRWVDNVCSAQAHVICEFT